ncbi:hypothetical protein HYU23_04310 [Candidatus Woesearchaeota archaeon]|nr:hypothetical protein [Candidatus Woesearchaeota archaeon]
MEIEDKLKNKILLILLKDISIKHTITSLAKELKITRVGIWKILKRLESQEFIKLVQIGKGKTSTYLIELKWDVLTEKTLALYLTEEALKQLRWRSNFEGLENDVDFIIIYGSILQSFKEANDIDILCIANKDKFIKIQNTINKIQKMQIKKIHDISFTKEEFEWELTNSNKAFIEAVKKGVVLFGQEKFVKFMKEVSTK